MNAARMAIETCCRPLWFVLAFPTCLCDSIRRCLAPSQGFIAALGLGVLLLPLAATAQTSGPSDRVDQSDQATTVEQEVLRNILRQPIGEQTVESLNLPALFLRRVSDRIIRSSYQQRYHMVVSDGDEAASPGTTLPQAHGVAMADEGMRVPPAGPLRNAPATITHRSWPYWAGLGLLIVAACAVVALRFGRGARR